MLALAVGLALLTTALGFQAVGGAAVARHRAGLAADLAALAGALHVAEGAVAACARARSVAAGNGAHLVDCVVTGDELTATVTVVPTGPAALVGSASARARAGPVSRRSPSPR
ncbi:hypothetical protein GCM10020369_26950 [Cryptosporangium minutisporangium]|uniref:Helicase n=1 Tax=Cryptosporangium minutisporangium TaxID=113569 RepID=A0ABP6SXM1_9ACTN